MAEHHQRGGIIVRLLLTVFILALLGGAVVGGVVFEAKRRIEAPGAHDTATILWIERGNGLETVGEKLLDLGVISDHRLFKVQARLEGLAASLQAGEFEIPAGASVQEIVELLKNGRPLQRFVTIPEGLTTAQILNRIADVDMLEGEVSIAPAEGDLLPETYDFLRGDTRDSVVQRMIDAHDSVLDDLWAARADDLPIETREQAVILASIVEKETGIAEERPRVASVFINRLRRGMRLQSDPTIIYGITGGEPLGRGIRRSELDRETPYNTYIIRGLPPTPIANPGREALAAVLNPPDTNDLYFVADGTGGHAFASSLAEHNRNVAQWRQVERRRAGN